MKKILVIQPIHEAGIELVKNNPDYDFEVIENTDTEFLKTKIKDFDGVSIRTAKLAGEVIDSANKLKIISRHGVGYDNLDIKYLKKNNIALLITATANAVSVAEHVMYMILSLSKGITEYDKIVRTGNFTKDVGKIETYELLNKEILIAGFGRVAKHLIKRCLAFEMKVKVYDPFVDKKTIELMGGKKIEDINMGLKTADFLSIHMPLTSETKNLINLAKLKTMKKKAIIINTARGGIINEKDLDTALNNKIIFGAGLDVFEKEPINRDNPLIKNKRALLSPHSATFTKECTARMGIETVQNLIDFFENKIKKNMIVKL